MQDIGGCRVVLKVDGLAQMFRDMVIEELEGQEDAIFGVKPPTIDYVEWPKDSGYRCIHIVSRFQPREQASQAYAGLFVETQKRSELQHLWATAVETVDAMRKFNLKAGKGPNGWVRFFQLTSALIARLENRPPVSGTPLEEELIDELRSLDADLMALRYLNGYARAVERSLQVFDRDKFKKDAPGLVVLDFNARAKRARVFAYSAREYDKALKAFMALEHEALDPILRQASLGS